MQQIWIRKFGRADVLSVETSNDTALTLAPDEVLVDVHYSGINFADIMMRLGFYKDAPPRPFIPGYEFSGVISAIGSNVKHLVVGDEVYGGSVFGGYVSSIKVPANMAIKKPDHLTLEQAAGLPVAFITAYAALVNMGRVRQGDKVMIDCASGGVGTLALQMLSKIGAQVVGLTSSPAKKELIESFGATALTHEEFANNKDLTRFDFILNSLGGTSIRRHYERLGPNGRIVCLGLSDGIKDGKRDFLRLISAAIMMPRFSIISMFDKNRGVFALNALKLMEDPIYLADNLAAFDKVSQWQLKPHIGKVFAHRDVALAHKMIEGKKAMGKVLLAWN